MGVLSKVEIVRRLRLPPEDLHAIVITPVHWDPEAQEPLGIDRDSIDLRLGARFLLPRAHRLEVLAFSESDPGKYYEAVQAVHIPPRGRIVVPAHGTILGATLEYIKFPFDVSGQVLTRSSLARRFISIATAPWIHPLYRGCLTLEIANASSTPITLSPGDPIGQLVLFTVEDATCPVDDEIEDVYFGPVHPELPMSKRKTVAIIGASTERSKFGNKAVRAYLDQGWEVYPVNPRGGEIEGVEVYKSIEDIPVPIDRVTLYLPPEVGIKVLPAIAAVKPAEFFVNPGSESDEFVEQARALGLDPILACSIIDLGVSPAEFSG